jgi:molecular chaperone GrpE
MYFFRPHIHRCAYKIDWSRKMTKHKSHDDKEQSSPVDIANQEELTGKLTAAEKKVNEHWERILRMQAENENALRRAERDVSNAHKYALEKFVDALLPIVDSLELSIANLPTETNASVHAILEGVDLTLKMFYAALEKFGVKQVNPLAEPFNPEFQQAISVQVDPNLKPNTVTAVLQKGYTLNNRLIRPALVVVSKAEE